MAVSVTAIGDLTTQVIGGSPTNVAVDAPTGVVQNDLMLMHITGGVETAPAGWTLVKEQGAAVVYSKLADSDDGAEPTFTFEASASQTVGARILRITGNVTTSPVSGSTSGNADSSSVVIPTITPSKIQSLIILFISGETDGNTITTSGYTLATSSPNFSEHYDEQFATKTRLHVCASGLRPEATATGNANATLSGAEVWHGIMVVVSPPDNNFTATPAAVALTGTTPAVTTVASSTVSPSALSLISTLNEPTSSSQEFPAFTNSDKSTTTWTNPDKTS